MRKECARRRVVTIATDGVPDLELGIPCEVFGVDREDVAPGWYRHELVTLGEPVSTAAGLTVAPGRGTEAIREADMLVVPAGRSMHAQAPRTLVDLLVAAHDRGTRIVSLCSGAFVLGHAGLLDGRRSTTHWMHANELATRFPGTRVDPDALYVLDGVGTSGGSTAALDLSLSLVEVDHGPQVANLVARRVVAAPHREGGQRVHMPPATYAPDTDSTCADSVAEALEWATENLSDATVAKIAGRGHISARTLNRRVPELTGQTPQAWLLAQRIARAQTLLETTDTTIAAIAAKVGLGTAVNVRQHFKATLGVTPGQYRSMYRSATPPQSSHRQHS